MPRKYAGFLRDKNVLPQKKNIELSQSNKKNKKIKTDNSSILPSPEYTEYSKPVLVRCSGATKDTKSIILDVKFHPLGKRREGIVAFTAGKSVIVFDYGEQKLVMRYKRSEAEDDDDDDYFNAVAWSVHKEHRKPKASVLAVGGELGTVHLIHVEKNLLFSLVLCEERINALTFSESQPTWLFCALASGKMLLYDTPQPSAITFDDSILLAEFYMPTISSEIISLSLDDNKDLMRILTGHKVIHKDGGISGTLVQWEVPPVKKLKKVKTNIGKKMEEGEKDHTISVESNHAIQVIGESVMDFDSPVDTCVFNYGVDAICKGSRDNHFTLINLKEKTADWKYNWTERPPTDNITYYKSSTVTQETDLLFAPTPNGEIFVYESSNVEVGSQVAHRDDENDEEEEGEGEKEHKERIESSPMAHMSSPHLETPLYVVAASSRARYVGAGGEGNLLCIWERK